MEAVSVSEQMPMKNRKQRRSGVLVRWVVSVVAALSLVVAGLLVFGCMHRVEWAAWGIVNAPNHGRAISPKVEFDSGRMKAKGVAQGFRVTVGEPRVSLAVWVVEPPDGARVRGTVLLLHGIWSGKESQLGMAQLLAGRGFRGILVDARGHGGSNGDFLSYGVRESRDYSELLDDLERRGLLTGGVGVYGVSYGAGCAVQLAGHDARIAAVVAVAPYSSLRSEVHSYARGLLPWALWGGDKWLDLAIRRAGEIGGFDPNAADGVAAVRNSAAHFLFIHGRKDEKIPWHESQALYEAGGARSKLIVVAGEGHDSITWDRTGVIGRETPAWFEQWLDPRANADP